MAGHDDGVVKLRHQSTEEDAEVVEKKLSRAQDWSRLFRPDGTSFSNAGLLCSSKKKNKSVLFAVLPGGGAQQALQYMH